MAAHVLHIGTDDCHRLTVLRSVGYEVEECTSLVQLAEALESAPDPVAVILSESESFPPEEAVSLSRKRSAAPVIFFRRANTAANEDEFDLVIPPLTAPEKWLTEVDNLMGRSREVQAQARVISEHSKSLIKEAGLARRGSERERERSVHERTRNAHAETSDLWRFPRAR